MSNEKNGNRLEAFKPNLTNVALGTFKDEKTGTWYVAKFQFDPSLGVTGKMEKVSAGNSKDELIERFKIMAAQDLGIG